jgi:DNA (cytosine-5)-methyltransferase 1
MTFDRQRQQGKILDLFAGAGGWEVGLGGLGLAALGIECEPWACKTAVAAGHARLQSDVACLDPGDFAPVWGLIGSPPCQAYSAAGNGLGRLDKPSVIACAHEIAAGNDTRARRLGECRDPRSLLTVEPLRFAVMLRPRWIALEQVPAVLELWTRFAALLGALGYESAVGTLSAERYGVPQTRKRAFLIASLDGPVALPAATHRSYNPRRRDVPADELGLQPWVSMAEALGWAPSEHVGFPRRDDRGDAAALRRRDRRPACSPAFALTEKTRSWTRVASPLVEIRRDGECVCEGFDPTTAPAQAVTPRVNRWQAHGQRRGANAVRVTVAQAAVLQGFPADYPWQGPRSRQFEQVGNAVPPPLARKVLERAIQASGAKTRRTRSARARPDRAATSSAEHGAA